MTYVSKLTDACWSLRPSNINVGPHQAKAPVTNATHVKPNVDSINDGFFDISENWMVTLAMVISDLRNLEYVKKKFIKIVLAEWMYSVAFDKVAFY